VAVYFVVQATVTDAEGMKAYGKAAGPTMGNVRGRPLAVDNAVTPIEGDLIGSRVVILEFEDEAAFREWYDSPEYQEALKLRLAASEPHSVLVRGLG